MASSHPPIVQPHHSHAHLASGSAINDELDTETEALIAKLALDDLAEVQSCRKGKGRADSLPSDEVIAHQLQTKEYNEWLSIMEDRITAENLFSAESLPPHKSSKTRLENPASAMDPVSITTPKNDGAIDNYDGSMEARYTVGKQAKAGPSTDPKRRVNCEICHDSCRYFEVLNTPCGHYYCRGCLEALVEAFTRDESLYPLRCCKDPIPIAEVLPILPPGLRDRFERKHGEFSVPSKDRLYCSDAICSTFLGSSEGRLSSAGIECPQCHVNTCPKCKELAHPGERCGVRASNEALQALAKTQRWQTCPGCQVVVELTFGCYHITCRCNTQFCYVCAARWKTCVCARWAEERLVLPSQRRG